MREYDTYIFDLDGTLLSTLDGLAASVNYALRVHGMPEHTNDDIRWFVGNGVRMLMERAVPKGCSDSLFERVFETFVNHYMEHSMEQTKPYQGVLEMLEELKRRGKNIAVVSNKFYVATQELCNNFFGDYVDVAIGEREGISKKPEPDMVNEALNFLYADKSNAVYIGDSDVDVETAKNSGLHCISVLWGFRDKDFLLEHGATEFISMPSELLMW